jgi:hypothetical protein
MARGHEGRRPSSRRPLACLLATVVVVTLVVLVVPRRQPEPTFQGRTLSRWVMSSTDHEWRMSPTGHRVENWFNSVDATNAIRRIGVKGLPFLLEWLAQEDPKLRLTWKQKAVELALRLPLPSKLNIQLRNSSLNAYDYASSRAPTSAEVLWCFQVLGSDASPATRELSRLALQQENLGASLRSIHALTSIGQPAVPSLLELSTNYSCPSRAQVVGALGTSTDLRLDQKQTREIALALVRCLSDHDIAVARQAAKSLGALRIEPELAIPALANGLRDPNLAFSSAQALGKFGESARGALLSLRVLLESPDLELRSEASNAIVRITQ